MTCKVFRNLIFLTFVTLVVVVVFIDDASAAEARPQRRRRPSANVDSEGDSISSAPVFPPRFMHQRRMNAKHQASNKQLAGKTVQSDIAESCKSEPGCEWGCNESDAYECTCRCKFEPTAFSPKIENSRFVH